MASAQVTQTPPVNPRAPSTSAPGTAAISGRVTDGSTGQPISGALVTLSTTARGISSSVVLRVSTDPGGRFVFTRLRAGQAYYLHALQFGYFDGGFGRDLPATPEGRPIALLDGEWFSEAAITLWRPASISGRLLDEAGEPVVGAYVRVLPQVLVSGMTRSAAGPSVKTDDRGAYRIAGLAPGKYVVSFPSVQIAVPSDAPPAALLGMTPENFVAATERMGRPMALPEAVAVDAATNAIVGTYAVSPLSRDGRMRVYPPTFYPGTRTIGDAALVDVQYGEERGGVDLVLLPEPTVRVSGRLVGPPEAVAGLTVRLLPKGSEGLGVGSEVATALTGATGTFTMPFVPTGEYTLLAARSTMQYHYAPGGSNLQTDLPEPPGFGGGMSGASDIIGATPGVGYGFRSGRGDLGYAGRMALTVTAPEVKDLVVELVAGITIRGRVVVESGTIAPMGGATGSVGGVRPAPGHPVFAEPADGSPEFGLPRGSLDATNRFEVTGLQAGQYRLRFWGVGLVKSIVWDGRDFTDEPFDASERRDFNDVVVTVTDQPATIQGSAQDERGNRVLAAVVLAFSTDRRHWSRYGFSPPRLQSALVGSNGAYGLRLPGGEYYVVAVDASRAGGLYDPAFLAAAARRAETVRVEWGETKSQVATLRVIR